MPCVTPVITSEFGERSGTLHGGTDYSLSCGSEVQSSVTGIVTEISTDGKVEGNNSAPSTPANFVKIQTTGDDGVVWEVWYWHLSEVLVEEGQDVKQNELIGYSGNTGYVRGNPELPLEEQGCDLHLEIHKTENLISII